MQVLCYDNNIISTSIHLATYSPYSARYAFMFIIKLLVSIDSSKLVVRGKGRPCQSYNDHDKHFKKLHFLKCQPDMHFCLSLS